MQKELQQLAENVWLLKQPLKFIGTEVGTRTTIIRLSDRSLWIHSPGPELPRFYQTFKQLGEVKYLVAPNPLHHMFLPTAMRMFPDATGYGPAAVQKKHPELSLTHLEKQTPPEWNSEIEMLSLNEGLRLDEKVFYHPQSQTLLMTDLLFNMKGKDWPTRFMLYLEGVSDKLGCTRLVSIVLLKDRKQMRHLTEKILQWDFKRMIMCHGEVIENEAREGFTKAMAWTGI